MYTGDERLAVARLALTLSGLLALEPAAKTAGASNIASAIAIDVSATDSGDYRVINLDVCYGINFCKKSKII